MLAEPTDTLPKLNAAGLATSDPEGAGVESVVEAPEVVEVPEVAAFADSPEPLALVTPAHPERSAAETNSVAAITRAGTRGLGDASERVKKRRDRKYFASIKTCAV